MAVSASSGADSSGRQRGVEACLVERSSQMTAAACGDPGDEVATQGEVRFTRRGEAALDALAGRQAAEAGDTPESIARVLDRILTAEGRRPRGRPRRGRPGPRRTRSCDPRSRGPTPQELAPGHPDLRSSTVPAPGLVTRGPRGEAATYPCGPAKRRGTTLGQVDRSDAARTRPSQLAFRGPVRARNHSHRRGQIAVRQHRRCWSTRPGRLHPTRPFSSGRRRPSAATP